MVLRHTCARRFWCPRSTRFAWFVLLAALVMVPQQALGKALLQEVDTTFECLAVADEMGDGSPDDTLVRMDRTTGQTSVIGATGTRFIEAISFYLNGNLLAANGGQLGTLDLATGQFTALSAPFGTGGGSEGEVGLQDVDSLAYDIPNDLFYGVHRRSGGESDLLFVIDPNTGAHVPDFFGAGIDYLPVDIVPDPDDPTLQLHDVDDIAIDPTTGSMYAGLNDNGAGGRFVRIDPTTGNVTQIADFRYPDPNPDNPALAGMVIDDMEGLAFFNDGQLYGSTGEHVPASQEADANKLFRIDKATGVGAEVGLFPSGQQDFEGLACLTIEPFIVLEKHTNGPGQVPQDADEPTGPFIGQGDAVQWTYYVTNTGSLTLTDVTVTDDQGVAVTCPQTELGIGEGMTCTAGGAAQLGQYANIGLVTGTPILEPSVPVTDSDPSHYFGVNPAIIIEKATNGEDADSPTGPQVPVGSTITWSYVVTNTGNITLTDVTVTDDQLPGFSCDLGTLAPNASDSCETTGTAEAGQYSNTGIVTGTPTLEDLPPVDDDDPSHYVGIPSGGVSALGDFVWLDTNGNGIQDGGEPGVANATVHLYQVSGGASQMISTTTTNSNGLYLFDNLPAGSYFVEFVAPDGFSFTTANVGDDATDSDADVPEMELSIDDGDAEPELGDALNYTISYTNTSSEFTATNVIISSIVPTGTTFLPDTSTPGWTCSATPAIGGNECTFTVAEVPPATTAQLAFVVELGTDSEEVPEILQTTVALVNGSPGRSDVVTLAVDEQDLTLDAGVVEGERRIARVTDTPRVPTPTGEEETEQPGNNSQRTFLPSLQRSE